MPKASIIFRLFFFIPHSSKCYRSSNVYSDCAALAIISKLLFGLNTVIAFETNFQYSTNNEIPIKERKRKSFCTSLCRAWNQRRYIQTETHPRLSLTFRMRAFVPLRATRFGSPNVARDKSPQQKLSPKDYSELKVLIARRWYTGTQRFLLFC